MTTTEPSIPWTQESAESLRTTSRIAGYAALAAATSMIIGAVLSVSSGADLDRALAANTTAEYLETATANQSLLVGNLTAWILGVLLFGVAGAAFFRMCRRRRTLAQIGLLCYWTAVPLAIASFVAMLAVVVQVAPQGTAEAVLIAEVMGWFGSRADWIATVLVVGIGPLLISVAGRDEWVPGWLAYWAMAAALAGILTVAAMFRDALSTYGFLVVPIGLGWTIAAGVVALGHARSI